MCRKILVNITSDMHVRIFRRHSLTDMIQLVKKSCRLTAELRHLPERRVLVLWVVPVPVGLGCRKWNLVRQFKQVMRGPQDKAVCIQEDDAAIDMG